MAKKPYLTKEQFVEYVGCIKKTCDKDDMLSEAIEKACNDDCRVIGLYGAECSAMVDLLSLAMGLEVGTCDGNEHSAYEQKRKNSAAQILDNGWANRLCVYGRDLRFFRETDYVFAGKTRTTRL